MNAGPPPLPWDQFPIPVRFVGRPALGELWRGCFAAGDAVGHARGLAGGILGTSAFFVVVVVVALAVFAALRSRR
jgi:hypothetical protein